jgi:hypothetical protein
VGGSKSAWIKQLFGRDLARMPRVRALIWFNGRKNWANWDVKSSRASLAAFRTAIASPRYSGRASDLVGSGLSGPWQMPPGLETTAAVR